MNEKKTNRTQIEIGTELAGEIEQKNLQEPFKSILYSKLLDIALQSDTPQTKMGQGAPELASTTQKVSGANNTQLQSPQNRASALCGQLSLDERQFFSLFELRDETFDVISKELLREKKDSEKQRKIALVYLYINEFCYGKKETLTQVLKKELNNLGVSENNLSTALKSYENFIKMAGQKGSHNTSYFLTYPGRTEAEQLIKKLAEGLNSAN